MIKLVFPTLCSPRNTNLNFLSGVLAEEKSAVEGVWGVDILYLVVENDRSSEEVVCFNSGFYLIGNRLQYTNTWRKLPIDRYVHGQESSLKRACRSGGDCAYLDLRNYVSGRVASASLASVKRNHSLLQPLWHLCTYNNLTMAQQGYAVVDVDEDVSNRLL